MDPRPADFGIPEVTELRLSTEHARRVAAVLDDPLDPRDGAALPVLWHWAFATPTAPTGDLGPDGHPRIPSGGPTKGLPRRMWAGGRVRVLGDLELGADVTRASSVLRAERKRARSGELMVVTVEHRLGRDGETLLVEEQDLVYRAQGAPVPLPEGSHREPAPEGGWAEELVRTPVDLFRFSAVTFNSHRIHYDHAYATAEEGYPALVVHGPLSAMTLAGSVRARTGRELAGFSFRATAPLFVDVPFTIVGAPAGEEDVYDLKVVRNDGTTAMTATARMSG
ncbi:acyl-CoA dehydrogenase [Actinocorallia populi]|uniref:acyl-CoA dehydrogenase n=1 Tax=Actinocorallia populi TaxID=2079200 RepID=UPI000D096770|nr:acyl-CoA dehydrogenase [Actinocorallia populi]